MNKMNKMNPKTVSDYIALFTAVKEKYGDIKVMNVGSDYIDDRDEMSDEFCDIMISSGSKSLIKGDHYLNDETILVLVID